MKCPICGSEEYYEGVYGPNCDNPDCGKTIIHGFNQEGESVTIALGENTSIGVFNNLDVSDTAKKLKINKTPKRKRLKRYGR